MHNDGGSRPSLFRITLRHLKSLVSILAVFGCVTKEQRKPVRRSDLELGVIHDGLRVGKWVAATRLFKVQSALWRSFVVYFFFPENSGKALNGLK